MPKPGVEIRDLGIGKLREQIAAMRDTAITFGYQGASGAEQHPDAGSATVATVAAWNEYGTVTASARPMGRTTMEENRDAFRELVKRTIANVIDGRADADGALEAAGEEAVAALRRTIARSREWAEANAASTVRAKGHDQPLIGEHQTLHTNASWAIRRGGVIVAQGGED